MTASTDEYDLDIRLSERVGSSIPAYPTTSDFEGCTSDCRTCGHGTPCKTFDC